MNDEDMILYGEDGEEMPLQILASRELEDCIYVLGVAPDDDEVAHFKCVPAGEDEVLFELVDDEHEEFDMVFNLFKDDYEKLGIEIDEIDDLDDIDDSDE